MSENNLSEHCPLSQECEYCDGCGRLVYYLKDGKSDVKCCRCNGTGKVEICPECNRVRLVRESPL